MKRVLVLGAGMVVKPLLDDLLTLSDVELHLATLNIERARALLCGRERATALEINAADEARLRPEVAGANVVVSFLPADQHVRIAQACLTHAVPLVTTSYVSPEMRALDGPARERGILLLNEAGLDPGIDHMTAVQAIRQVQREGDRVVSFASYCGAIPAPEANTNPWGYKFAWSPRGVVLAARNPVRYLEGGKVIERTFPDLFGSPRQVEIAGVGPLEAYPNRDCLRYLEPYGLTGVQDFFRGTLRYPGWCETWHVLVELGLLDLEASDWTGMTYADFLARHLPPQPGALVERLARKLGVPPDHPIIARLGWLGLLSDRSIAETVASPLDILTSLLEGKLRYKPGERDLVILEHRFIATRGQDGLRKIVKRIVLYGQAGDESALARTVSLPAAIACRLLLEGRARLAGVRIPVDAELADPIVSELARRGIHVEEWVEEFERHKKLGVQTQ